MKMVRKSNVMLLVVVALIIALLAIVYNNSNRNVDAVATNTDATDQKYVTTHAKIKSYNNFNTLDNDTDIILRGTKTSVKQTIVERKQDGDITDYRTLSIVKVEKTFKGKLEDGGTITVQENAAVEGNIVYSTNGYELMRENEEYLLFLRESKTDPNVYIVKGVIYGKIPSEEFNETKKITVEDLQYKGDSTKVKETLRVIFEEALKKYN